MTLILNSCLPLKYWRVMSLLDLLMLLVSMCARAVILLIGIMRNSPRWIQSSSSIATFLVPILMLVLKATQPICSSIFGTTRPYAILHTAITMLVVRNTTLQVSGIFTYRPVMMKVTSWFAAGIHRHLPATIVSPSHIAQDLNCISFVSIAFSHLDHARLEFYHQKHMIQNIQVDAMMWGGLLFSEPLILLTWKTM